MNKFKYSISIIIILVTMKRLLLIIFIALFSIASSGCASQSSTDPIIGTWTYEEYAYSIHGALPYSSSISFYDDGKGYLKNTNTAITWYKVSWTDEYPYKITPGNISFKIVDNNTLIMYRDYKLHTLSRVTANEQSLTDVPVPAITNPQNSNTSSLQKNSSISGKILINGERPHGYTRSLLLGNQTYVDATGVISIISVRNGSYFRQTPIDCDGNYYASGIYPAEWTFDSITIYGENKSMDKEVQLGTTPAGVWPSITIIEKNRLNNNYYYNVNISAVYINGLNRSNAFSPINALSKGTTFDDLPGGLYYGVAKITPG